MPDTLDRSQPSNWPELAEGLFAFLTGRRATIEYDFSDFQVDVPSATSANSPSARWRLNGKLSVRTSEQKQ